MPRRTRKTPASASSRLFGPAAAYPAALTALLVLLGAVSLSNAHVQSPDLGYDAENHQHYTRVLIEERRVPRADEPRAAYNRPPGFYAVAGLADAAGEPLGLGEHKAVQYLNAVLVVAAALLVLVFVRELWPRRQAMHVAALAFFALVPVTVKSAAM